MDMRNSKKPALFRQLDNELGNMQQQIEMRVAAATISNKTRKVE
jgi:hypothetical protein